MSYQIVIVGFDEALAAGAPRLLLDNMDDAQLRAAVAQVAGRARKAASTLGEAYGRASEIAGKVDPFVQEKPYAALGLALAAGLLLGLLIAGGQPKIVYIKQKT